MKIRFEKSTPKKVWPDRPFVVITKAGCVYLVGNDGTMIGLASSGPKVADTNWKELSGRDETFSLYTGVITIQND